MQKVARCRTTIRNVVVIHMLMVAAMFGGPKKNKILEGASSENDREEPPNLVSPRSGITYHIILDV